MILVTGATGNVGRCVVQLLAAAGETVRAVSRNPSAVQLPAGVEVIAADLGDPESLGPVFAGIERMFFFTPPSGGPAIVEAAHVHGVRRMVVLSSAATQKADPRTNPIAARHDAVEKAVAAAGMTWTFLRPDSFASNALAWADSIRTERVVRGAYPRSQRNPIHEADIAAVATAALLDDGHANAAYFLTGPAAITQAQQVQVIGDAIGHAVRFEELTRAQALAQMTATQPAAIAERLLDYAAKSVATAPAVTADVQRVTGRPAYTFALWAHDHADAFR